MAVVPAAARLTTSTSAGRREPRHRPVWPSRRASSSPDVAGRLLTGLEGGNRGSASSTCSVRRRGPACPPRSPPAAHGQRCGRAPLPCPNQEVEPLEIVVSAAHLEEHRAAL